MQKTNPISRMAVLAFFADLKRTHYKGRMYSFETLAHYVRAKALNVNLEALGLYPEGFDPKEIGVTNEGKEYLLLQRQPEVIKEKKPKKVKGA